MREGAAYINNHKYIKSFFIFCAVFFILAAPASFLTPLQVARSFGDDVWRLTAIEVLFSVGMMLGGITIAVWGGFKNRVHTMTLAFLIFGFCTFALGVIPNFWIYLFFMGITGISIPFFNTSHSFAAGKGGRGFLGRVFGVLGMISSVMMPLGMLVFGHWLTSSESNGCLLGPGYCYSQGFFLVGNKTLVEAGNPCSTQMTACEHGGCNQISPSEYKFSLSQHDDSSTLIYPAGP